MRSGSAQIARIALENSWLIRKGHWLSKDDFKFAFVDGKRQRYFNYLTFVPYTDPDRVYAYRDGSGYEGEWQCTPVAGIHQENAIEAIDTLAALILTINTAIKHPDPIGFLIGLSDEVDDLCQ